MSMLTGKVAVITGGNSGDRPGHGQDIRSSRGAGDPRGEAGHPGGRHRNAGIAKSAPLSQGTAQAVLFRASPESAYIIEAEFCVDGGMSHL